MHQFVSYRSYGKDWADALEIIQEQAELFASLQIVQEALVRLFSLLAVECECDTNVKLESMLAV